MMITQFSTTPYLAHDKLRDGRPILIRTIDSKDRSILIEVMHHLSPESRYFRYLRVKNEPSAQDLDAFADLNVRHHVALVASLQESGKEVPLGLGEYFVNEEQKEPLSAELAFAVAEEYQGLGIATCLLNHLAIIARQAGVVEFTALVHPENRKMLEVFVHSQYPVLIQNVFAAVKLRLKLL